MTKAESLEHQLKLMPQIPVTTYHSLHAGIYTRTLKLDKDMMISSAFIKIPTTISIVGEVDIILNDKSILVRGYKLIEAEANRKTVMYAKAESYVTMSFKTSSKTIEECEKEFTDDYENLKSHEDEAINIYQRRLQ